MSKLANEKSSAEDERRHTAAYVAEFSRELAAVARVSRLDLVATLLEMAGIEASGIASETRAKPARRSSPIG